MKCSICGRVSANGNHTDCMEKRRIETEDEHWRSGAAERISLEGTQLGPEIRALLNHMKKN